MLSNGLLKERQKGLEDEKEDVSSYPMTFRKRENLKEDAFDRTLWRTCSGRGYGRVVRQTTK
jgi:hypothetical protein